MTPTLEAASPVLIRLLASFMVGSIPFAVLAMLGSGIDIRKVGSGNPGFNNVLRVSKPRAVLTLIGDMGKGILAVWLFHKAGDNMTLGWLYGFAVVLGHCYSPFLKFNGGKGIATSAGVMLVLYPRWAAMSLIAYPLLRLAGSKLKWKEAGTVASISSSIFFVVLMAIFVGRVSAIYAALLALLLIWRHKKNFQIILAEKGTGGLEVASRKQ